MANRTFEYKGFYLTKNKNYFKVFKIYFEIGDQYLNVCDNLIQKKGLCGIAIDTGTTLFAGPSE